METWTFLVVLALATFLAVIAFAGWSKKRTDDAMDDPNHTKSTLASDAPNERRSKTRHAKAQDGWS